MADFGPLTTGKNVADIFTEQVHSRTFLITGPSTDSIGAEIATSLAYGSPAQIILLGRDVDKTQPIIEHIKIISPDTQTIFIQVSLDSFSSIQTAVEKIRSDPSIDKIDVLINNAGVMAAPYGVTEDGIESHLQINHLSHFLLTSLLIPKLTVPGSLARVVNTSSYGNIFSDILDDPTFGHGKTYNPWLAYGQSKTANILHAVALNQKYGAQGLRAWAVNPGSVPTNLRRYLTPETMQLGMALHKEYGVTPPARKTLQRGCATSLRAALDPELSANGSIFLDDCNITTNPKVVASYALDKMNAERCWELSKKLIAEASTPGRER